MLIGIDKDGNRVHIDNADRTTKYYCPCCKSELIPKRGKERIHHFAHCKCNECNDSWRYDMTDWHYQWQNRFPLECLEVVKNYNGETHRADVLIEEFKTVFEFQHSPMPSWEFIERNSFYNKLGYKVIWIFDIEQQYQNDKLSKRENHWEWYRPIRTFDDYEAFPYSGELFFEYNNTDITLMRVTAYRGKAGTSYFYTDGNEYDDYSIVNMLTSNEIQTKTYLVENLYDELIRVGSLDHTNYYFGCPISKTHKCADTDLDMPYGKYDIVMPCNKCEYSKNGEYSNYMVCNKRFLDLGFEPGTRARIAGRDSNGFINKLSLSNNGSKTIEVPTYSMDSSNDDPKSIIEFWMSKHCSAAVFRNIKSGIFVGISKDPREQLSKYNKIYGKISSNSSPFQNGVSREVFYADKPVWICTWSRSSS